eukprot:SAG22_NODE_108_length_19750_cov_3.848201_3_plen_695_part_00
MHTVLWLAVCLWFAPHHTDAKRKRKSDRGADGPGTADAEAFADLQDELAGKWTSGSDKACARAGKAVAKAQGKGVSASAAVVAVVGLIFEKYYEADGLPLKGGLASMNRCAAKLFDESLKAENGMFQPTMLPSPVRVVLLALHMQATELMELLITKAGVPMWYQFEPLYNATLIHGLVSPHPESSMVVREYLLSHQKSSVLRKRLPAWWQDVPGATKKQKKTLEIPCADGTQLLTLGQPSYRTREIERCLTNVTDTRILEASLAQLEQTAPEMIGVADSAGNTALHYAAYYGNEAAAAVLIKHGINVDSPNVYGLPALYTAAIRGYNEVAELLVQAGANWSAELPPVPNYAPRAVKELRPEGAPLNFVRRPLPPLAAAAASRGGGGWSDSVLKTFDVDHCDFERKSVKGMTPEQIQGEVFGRGVPVVLTDAMEDWPAFERWTRDGILRNFGDLNVDTGSIPYADAVGNGPTVKMQLKDVLATDMGSAAQEKVAAGQDLSYVFDNNVLDSRDDGAVKALIADMRHPAEFGDKGRCQTDRDCPYEPGPHQFILGAAGSGAHMHTHQDAWNALVYGRKRWFVVPPSRATYSRKHIRRWLVEDYPHFSESEKPLECVQRGGEVLYMPGLWGHGVLNLVDSVGAAVEFRHVNRLIRFNIAEFFNLPLEPSNWFSGSQDPFFKHDKSPKSAVKRWRSGSL